MKKVLFIFFSLAILFSYRNFHAANSIIQDRFSIIPADLKDTSKSKEKIISHSAISPHHNSNPLSQLKDQVLDLTLPGELRQSSLYTLTQSGPSALADLTEIAATPVPYSLGSALQDYEISLRITTLEALDKIAAQNISIRKELELIMEKQSNSTLKFFAQISLAGVLQNRPGKLSRWFEALLAQKAE